MGRIAWTAEMIDRLRELRAEGYAASRIAAILGVSRNAVLGKAHRLGLAVPEWRRKKPLGDRRARPRPAVRRSSPFRHLAPHVYGQAVRAQTALSELGLSGEDIVPLIGSFLELQDHHCRWPYGQHSYRFCGRLRTLGAYCRFHALVCNQRVEPNSLLVGHDGSGSEHNDHTVGRGQMASAGPEGVRHARRGEVVA